MEGRGCLTLHAWKEGSEEDGVTGHFRTAGGWSREGMVPGEHNFLNQETQRWRYGPCADTEARCGRSQRAAEGVRGDTRLP